MAASPARQSKSELLHFFCFNPIFDKSEETEHEKLLFFWPPDVQQDAKMKSVGLAEAMIKFSSTFSKDKACEVVHTKKARMVFFNPEPNFWLQLAVTIPFSQSSKKDASVEYHGETVQNKVIESLLQQTYQMFKLFNGTFTSILDAFGRDALVHKLDLFFPQHLHTLDFEQSDVVEAFNGIQFLPLDKNTFLDVQCFVNLTESKFPAIRYTVFIFHDHLIWSGLEQEDMRVLYRYLTQGQGNLQNGAGSMTASGNGGDSLLDSPSSIMNSTGATSGNGGTTAFTSGGDSARSTPVSPLSHPTGDSLGFITGPEDLTDPETPINAPRLFVTTDDTAELHLVIFSSAEVKMCFLVEASTIHDLEFYKDLKGFIAARVVELERSISEQQSKRTSIPPEVQYKYLYFNHMNLAQKSSFMTLPKKAGQPVMSSVSPEYIRYLTDMHTDFAGSMEESEIILKTEGDCWFVGRQSDQRQFFVILAQKNANLIEINEEIRRLSSSHFGNIFMVD